MEMPPRKAVQPSSVPLAKMWASMVEVVVLPWVPDTARQSLPLAISPRARERLHRL